jgi:hypothetical protein
VSEDDVSFELHIQDLFNQRDQEAMLLQFDLWDYEDVRANAEAIYRNVASGRMPCYTFWSKDKVALFRRWMDAGMPE